MERSINAICTQFCPAAPRGFCQFPRGGAGLGKACFLRGGAAYFPRGGAGRPSLILGPRGHSISSYAHLLIYTYSHQQHEHQHHYQYEHMLMFLTACLLICSSAYLHIFPSTHLLICSIRISISISLCTSISTCCMHQHQHQNHLIRSSPHLLICSFAQHQHQHLHQLICSSSQASKNMGKSIKVKLSSEIIVTHSQQNLLPETDF